MELLFALLAFFTTIAGHFLLVRISLPGSGVMKYALVSTLVGPALASSLWWYLDATAFRMAVSLSAYAFACELYVFLFTMTYSSISATLLRRLQQHDMTVTEIETLYAPKDMVEKRLQRLRSAGLLCAKSSAITSKGRFLVWAFRLLRRFFQHPAHDQRVPPTDDRARAAA